MIARRLGVRSGGASFPVSDIAYELVASPNGGVNSINERQAVYDPTNGHVYYGGVTDAGDLTLVTWDDATRTVLSSVTLDTGVEGHAVPSVLLRADGKIMVCWSEHDGAVIWKAVSTNVHDGSAFGSPASFTAPTGFNDYTYMNLHQLADESDRIYLIYREFHTVGRVALTYSDDNGSTWSNRTLLLVAGGSSGDVVYWKPVDDGQGKIHLFHTDTDRSDANPSSLFHRYYDAADGLWHKSDGTTVSSTDPTTSSLIHDDSQGPVHPASTGLEADGTPFVAYQILVDGATDNDFYVARYRSGAWRSDYVTNSNGLPGHRTVGSIAVNRTNPDRTMCCVKVGSIFEVFLYTSPDDGATWSGVPVSVGSAYNNLTPAGVWGEAPHSEFVWVLGNPAGLGLEAYG